MFEHFSQRARAVVVQAQEEARGLGHTWIGAEHLMLGVLAQSEETGVADLVRLGVTRERWRRTLTDVLGPPGPGFSSRDADALAALGIDLAEVRRRVEDSFGPGALEPDTGAEARAEQRRTRRWNRRFRHGRGCGFERNPLGHIPFTPRAKRALERSLREAKGLGDRDIGVEHLILGVLDPEGNMATRLLDRLGVQPHTAREAVLAARRRAA